MVSFSHGGMAERSKAVVLKTTVLETVPGVRIPLPPLLYYYTLLIKLILLLS